MVKSAIGAVLGLLVFAAGWAFELAIWLMLQQSQETPQFVLYVRSLPRDEALPYVCLILTVILGFPTALAWIVVKIYDRPPRKRKMVFVEHLSPNGVVTITPCYEDEIENGKVK